MKKVFRNGGFVALFIIIAIGAIGCGNSKNGDATAVTESIEAKETENTEMGSTSAEAAVENTTAEESAPTKFEIAINADGHKDGNEIIFDINTNLPDTTVLMLTLSRGDYNSDDYFSAQTQVTIADGKAISEGFSNKGEALSGEYDLNISMSLPSLQSETVRAVIGENGEYMTGSLVEASSIGSSNVVSALFSVATDDDVIVTSTDDYTHTIFRKESEDEKITEAESSDHTADNSQTNKDFIEKYDNEIVVAAKMALDNFISDYDMSLAPQRWTLAKFDDQDAVIGMTDISFKGQKGRYIYVGTLSFDNSGKVVSAQPHHIEVLGQVLGDDGYCDDLLDTLKQFSAN